MLLFMVSESVGMDSVTSISPVVVGAWVVPSAHGEHGATWFVVDMTWGAGWFGKFMARAPGAG